MSLPPLTPLNAAVPSGHSYTVSVTLACASSFF